MLELVYRIVSKTIAHTGLGVRVPSPVKFEKPPFMGGFLNFTGKKANCFAFVGTRRAERCFCLRCVAPKGKNREPRAGGKFRQEFYRKPSPYSIGFYFFCGKKANCFAFVGTRSPQRCVSFAEGKGEHREGRPCSIFRQENDGRAIPYIFL